MEKTFEELNKMIIESPNKQFITYCYTDLQDRRLSCFGKKVGNNLYIKVYRGNPKEQFDKTLIKKHHAEHGYFSESGTLHVVKCVNDSYKSLFFNTLDNFYQLNREIAMQVYKKQIKKIAISFLKEYGKKN